MYIKRALLKKYLEKIADKILQNPELSKLIEQEKAFNLEDRILLGEKVCLSLEFEEDDDFCYICLSTWQLSHWSFFWGVMCPVSYRVPIRKK